MKNLPRSRFWYLLQNPLYFDNNLRFKLYCYEEYQAEISRPKNSKGGFMVKKLLITIAIFSCLLFLSANDVLAGDVYLDYMRGTWKDTYHDDLLSGTIGFQQYFDRFKIGIEYTDSKLRNFYSAYDYAADSDKYFDGNYRGFDLKTGYRITDQFAITLGYHRFDLTSERSSYSSTSGSTIYTAVFADYRIKGITVGFDTDIPITDRFSFASSFDYGWDGKIKVTNDDEDGNSTGIDIYLGKAKFNYDLTSNLKASLGYRYTLYKFSDNSKERISGVTAGFDYKFPNYQTTPSQETKQIQQPKVKNEEIKKEIVKNESAPVVTTVLILKNDFHDTKSQVSIGFSGPIQIGSMIELTAAQVGEVKDQLCGPYVSPNDGETGIRDVWHQFGNVDIKVQQVIKHDNFGKIVGAMLTITEIRKHK